MKRLLLLSLLLSPVSVLADDTAGIHPYLGTKWYASVGLFLPNQDMELSLDATIDVTIPEPAPHYDMSQTFGTESSDQTFSAEFGWRFGEKWQMRGQYFRIDNDARATLDEDVEWGEYTFNEGTNVGAGADMQITRFFFGRSFKSSDSNEFGLGIGGHILDLSAYVDGDATVDGVNVGYVFERASISQPLPNLGTWYMHAFSPKVAFSARLDWLAASFDRYDGHIINAAANLGYAVSNHFGIALAYNFFELDVNVNESDWHGGIRTRFQGPFISLTGYW